MVPESPVTCTTRGIRAKGVCIVPIFGLRFTKICCLWVGIFAVMRSRWSGNVVDVKRRRQFWRVCSTRRIGRGERIAFARSSGITPQRCSQEGGSRTRCLLVGSAESLVRLPKETLDKLLAASGPVTYKSTI
mgnify:CR=1 FL=1